MRAIDGNSAPARIKRAGRRGRIAHTARLRRAIFGGGNDRLLRLDYPRLHILVLLVTVGIIALILILMMTRETTRQARQQSPWPAIVVAAGRMSLPHLPLRHRREVFDARHARLQGIRSFRRLWDEVLCREMGRFVSARTFRLGIVVPVNEGRVGTERADPNGRIACHARRG